VWYDGCITEREEYEMAAYENDYIAGYTPDMSNARFDGDRPASEAPPMSEKVAPIFACPCCGERRMDWLAWNTAGTVVTCTSCRADYDPNEEA
jgi:hypothetical protein